MKRRDPYESKRTRHAPRVHVGYSKTHGRVKATLLTGEPRCGAPIGPGATSSLDVLVSCEDCKRLMAEEK